MTMIYHCYSYDIEIAGLESQFSKFRRESFQIGDIHVDVSTTLTFTLITSILLIFNQMIFILWSLYLMRQSSGFVICLAVSKYVNSIIEEEEHASLSRNILKILPGLREI